MREGVIDDQRDSPGDIESCEDKHTDAMGQGGGIPGGAFEEVVGGVEAVALGVVGEGVGLGVSSDAEQGVSSETHDPAEKDLAVGGKGGLCESGANFIDDGLQRKYHGPHGGTFLFLRTVFTLKHRGCPHIFHPSEAVGHLNGRSEKSANV
jgi:hypothetical protein